MKYTTDQIERAYKNTSPKIRGVLDGVWVANVCGEIGKDLNLRIDKVDTLIRVVGLTLLNIVSLSGFIKVVEKELDISDVNATSVAKKVDEYIFKKIREIVVNEDGESDMENLFDESDEVESEGIIDLMDDIENRADDNMSFKDRFNKVTVTKKDDRMVDPYRESID